MTFKKSLFLVIIIFYFEINFNITWLPYNIFIDLWYQTTQQIMEKDIKLFTNCHVPWDTLYIKFGLYGVHNIQQKLYSFTE